MPLRGQQPAEVVRAATRLHRYHAARQLGRQPHDALSPHPPTQHHTPRRVQPDHAAAVLAQVDPDNTNVHCLTLLSSTRTWWRRGAGHSIKGARITPLAVLVED